MNEILRRLRVKVGIPKVWIVVLKRVCAYLEYQPSKPGRSLIFLVVGSTSRRDSYVEESCAV